MRAELFAAACLMAAALAVAPRVHAQDETSRPVLIAKEKPQNKKLKFKGEVISANSAAITVRGQDNPREVQTFSYTTKVRDGMIEILKQGGYRGGDKVTIEYFSGTTVATHISGKPSKSH